MPYQNEFVLFWEHVKESVEKGQFAKLTMAKTIGKPNLRNIFVRPVYSDNDFKVLLKLRYRSRDTEDKEDELTLDEAFVVLKSHLKKHFSTVLLFSTAKDVTFKVNKKGIGSITENLPTFSEVIQAERDE
ncbi:MAG: hypothetical protein KAG96_05225 [Ichthyobacteriaceae bacterium]|nr:hypothetical protein [Ichthyobacteriaceae bacterium]